MSQVVGYEQGQVERFHNSYIVDPDTDCWEWQLNLHQGGYGRCYFNGINYRAHRLSYLLHKGELPDSLNVCHKCDNPKCVNPEHLYLGSQSENMNDKKIRNRSKGINSGTFNGRSKLSDKEINEIRDLLSCKLFSQKFIAKKYNVDQSHISRISTNQIRSENS